jgi:nitrite reductase [NAD(P)H] small subunit
MSLPMNPWLEVCALDDLPVSGARKLCVGPLTIALIRPDGERVYALEDRCPHRGGPLSEGIVSADRVACPLHGQCVELASGRMVAPDEGEVRSFAVRIENGRVLLQREDLRARPTARSPQALVV